VSLRFVPLLVEFKISHRFEISLKGTSFEVELKKASGVAHLQVPGPAV
jgi:hypothetical protein